MRAQMHHGKVSGARARAYARYEIDEFLRYGHNKGIAELVTQYRDCLPWIEMPAPTLVALTMSAVCSGRLDVAIDAVKELKERTAFAARESRALQRLEELVMRVICEDWGAALAVLPDLQLADRYGYLLPLMQGQLEHEHGDRSRAASWYQEARSKVPRNADHLKELLDRRLMMVKPLP
jgi:hypothetical protein